MRVCTEEVGTAAAVKYCEKLLTFQNLLRSVDTGKSLFQKFQTVDCLRFLYDHIERKFEKPSTRIQYYNALKQLSLDANQHLVPDSDESIPLSQFVTGLDTAIKEGAALALQIERKNLITDPNEKKRWMQWGEILALRANLDYLVVQEECRENYQIAQQHLLIHMYTDLIAPLRLDFGTVSLVSAPATTTAAASEAAAGPALGITTSNWIDLKDYTFHLGHDKVSYKIGGASFCLPLSIVRIIMDMEMKYPGRRYLLTDPWDVTLPLVDNTVDRTHKRALVKLLKSIPLPGTVTVPSGLSVDTMRSSFVTNLYRMYGSMPTMETQVLIAHQMRTSVAQMQTSYYKFNQPPACVENDNNVY